MLSRSACWIALIVCCVLLMGCGKRPDSEANSSTPAGTAPIDPIATPASGTTVWERLPEEKCLEFAMALQTAVANGDAASFNNAVDWDAVMNEATKGIKAAAEIRRAFETGSRNSLLGPASMGKQLCDALAQGGSYTFIRLHEKAGRQWLLFRLILPNDAGVNYHDLPLHRTAEGTIKASDMYLLMSGELISETFRRTYLLAVSSTPNGLVERLVGRESDFAKHVTDIQNMALAHREGRHDEVLAIYNRLPSSLKQDKNILFLRFQAAQQLGEDKYSAAINDFRKYHPNDPCVNFLSIDGYILRNEYPSALDAVDRTEKMIGGDAYLDLVRASIHVLDEDYDQARRFAQRAVDNEPTLVDAYWTLVSISLASERFDDTARLLDMIEEKLELAIVDLTTVPEYAEFVKSPEYAAWLKARTGEP